MIRWYGRPWAFRLTRELVPDGYGSRSRAWVWDFGPFGGVLG